MKIAVLLAIVWTAACGATFNAGGVAPDVTASDLALSNDTVGADASDAATDAVSDVPQCPGKAPHECCKMLSAVSMICGPSGWECPADTYKPFNDPGCSNPCEQLCASGEVKDTATDVAKDLESPKDVAKPDVGLDTAPDAKPEVAAETVDDVASVGGQVGDLCGESGEPACAKSLVCCYPCGIPGCHNKCAVPCTGPGCNGGCPMLP